MPKEQAFVPIPGEKLLEAIGVVVVKWSALEWSLNNALFWASDPNNSEELDALTGGETSRRWRLLKRLLQERYGVKPGALEMVGLVDQAMSLKTKRDNVIHGIYGEDPNDTNAVFAILIKKAEYKHERRMDRPSLMKLASDIDRLVAKIFNLQIDSAFLQGHQFARTPWRHPDRND